MDPTNDLFALAEAEIRRLHVVIEGWLRGSIDPDSFAPDFVDALHPDFEIVHPDGSFVPKEPLVADFRSAHGANPDFRIAIEQPRLLGSWPGLILASYVEHQTGARVYAPENWRRSTVLFEVGDRPLWRHLHETALRS